MRSFLLVLFGLAALLVASCNKNTIGSKIVGNWRLVTRSAIPEYGDPPIHYQSSELILRPLNLYKITGDNTVIVTGSYRIDETANPPRPTIHFSGDRYSYWVSFSKDSLILTYADVDDVWGFGKIKKYVKE